MRSKTISIVMIMAAAFTGVSRGNDCTPQRLAVQLKEIQNSKNSKSKPSQNLVECEKKIKAKLKEVLKKTAASKTLDEDELNTLILGLEMRWVSIDGRGVCSNDHEYSTNECNF